MLNLTFRLNVCIGNLFMGSINNGWQMKSISYNLLSIIIILFNKVVGFESTLIKLRYNRSSYYLFLLQKPSQVTNLPCWLSLCSGNLFMSYKNNGWHINSITYNRLSIIIIHFNKSTGFESTLNVLQFNRYSYYLFLF